MASKIYLHKLSKKKTNELFNHKNLLELIWRQLFKLQPLLFDLLKAPTSPHVAARRARGDRAAVTAAHAAEAHSWLEAVHPAVAEATTIPASGAAAANSVRRKRRHLLHPRGWQRGWCDDTRYLEIAGRRQLLSRRGWCRWRRGFSHARRTGWREVRRPKSAAPA